MNSSEPNHKYFGALTIALKAKLSLRNAGPEINTWVIQGTLQCFAEAVDEDQPPFILQRLSSTIVKVFLENGIAWQNCLKDVFSLMAHRDLKRTLTYETIHLQECIETVSDAQMGAVLTTFITLAEEARRIPFTGQEDSVHRRVATNAGAVVTLLNNLYARLRGDDRPEFLLPEYSHLVPKCHLQWMKLYQVTVCPKRARLSYGYLRR